MAAVTPLIHQRAIPASILLIAWSVGPLKGERTHATSIRKSARILRGSFPSILMGESRGASIQMGIWQ